MSDITGAIRNTLPISLFNRGQAGKIFEEVKISGTKVVMKNNTAECVLISPEEYLRLMDELNDARLFAAAAERMARFDPDALISAEDVYKKYGITPGDIAEGREAEIE